MRLLTVLACLFALSCASTPEAAPAPKPPNIVLIMADDLGYNDIGANGSTIIHTPHIDALARDGVRATDGYVAAAVCSPSRAGLHTGRYQTRFGHEFNPSGRDTEIGLPLDQRTMAQMLSDAGYATGLVGKWHLGKKREYHPLNRGFDEYFGMLSGGSSYIDSRKPGVSSWPAKNAPTERPDSTAIFDGFEKVQVDDYLTDVFADKAADFIERHKDEPFFLMVTPNAPHTPLQATEPYMERYPDVQGDGRRIFSAMVSAVDDLVGDVTAQLAKHGLEDNTLVVFLSDNGCVKYLSEDVCSNDPLSGSKRFHLEGGIRIPYLLKWPAKLPKGTTYSQPIISLDLFSTFAAAAGSDERSQDGVDLTPYLTGETAGAPHEYLFWRAKPNIAVRWGNWKMWKVNKSNQKLADMTVGGERLPEIDFPGDSPLGQMTVLYDLSADISEQKNLAAERPDIVEKLDAELAKWNAQLAEPLWPSNRSTLYELDGQMVQLFF
ncbi:MAG: sulfatase-like hydrolase/transferase [Bryobacterales bacterium]|nr:sulfatase-like hydrolase/transferase [Acidobacteriota bacterium]MCB9385327.1 sulfatase-like hydrolase/transferase [Bryobacterales bacterium]